MSFIIFIVIGVLCVFAIWWKVIPEASGPKALQMGVSLIGAAALGAVGFGLLLALCAWASQTIGHQPLHM